MTPATPIIEAKGLSKRFVKQADLAERLLERLGAGQAPSVVHAVDNVSLAINNGEVVGPGRRVRAAGSRRSAA